MDSVSPASEVILYDRLIKTNSTYVDKANVQKMERLAKYTLRRLSSCAELEERLAGQKSLSVPKAHGKREDIAALDLDPHKADIVDACQARMDAAMRCLAHVATEIPGYTGGLLRNELNSAYAATRKAGVPCFRTLILLRCVPSVFPQSRFTVLPRPLSREARSAAVGNPEAKVGQDLSGELSRDLSRDPPRDLPDPAEVPSSATAKHLFPPSDGYSNPVYEAALQLTEYTLVCMLQLTASWDHDVDEVRLLETKNTRGYTLFSPAGLFLVECGAALAVHTGVYVPVLVQALEKMLDIVSTCFTNGRLCLSKQSAEVPPPLSFKELLVTGRMFSPLMCYDGDKVMGSEPPVASPLLVLECLLDSVLVLSRLYQGLPCSHIFSVMSDTLSSLRGMLFLDHPQESSGDKTEAAAMPPSSGDRIAQELVDPTPGSHDPTLGTLLSRALDSACLPGTSLQPMHLLPPPVPLVKELSPAFMVEFRPGKTMDANLARQKLKAEEKRARRLQRDEYREAVRGARAAVAFKQRKATSSREKRTRLANRVSEAFAQETSGMKKVDKESRSIR